jgi:very-short-patch-repair endonuclease
MRGSRELQQAAKGLRKEMTSAERQLWNGLRGWKLAKFRRQHPLDRFILDFYCPAHRLCIEVDGSVHDTENQRERDAARDEALAAAGIRTLRIRNEEVLTDIRAVLRRIEAEPANGSRRVHQTKVPSPTQFVGEGGEPKRAG